MVLLDGKFTSFEFVGEHSVLLRHVLGFACHFGGVVKFDPYLREHIVLPYMEAGSGGFSE